MWEYSEDSDIYVTALSDYTGKKINCPKCKGLLLQSHEVEVECDNENEIAGWLYVHPCGAKLLVIND
jgi:hypothetical protein